VCVRSLGKKYLELQPYVIATLMAVVIFFCVLMAFAANPFSTSVAGARTDGEGLNPLLQNYWMVIHPPSLYTGFVGMTIPFAFGLAALITGHLDDSWLRAVRRWTMFAWLFLSFGLMLGMIWAYEVLAWGGYWGWDPVENAAVLPWFTATAFLHSVMVQERRSMLRVWNVTLVILTFFLTIFGTFLTRSGVVASVHAFGDDPMLARLFSAFMIAILTFSFGMVIYRLPLLKARAELDSWVSREAAFLVNNWILLFCAFFVAFATMFPTLSEAVTGTRMTVGPPFFNKWMLPIGLVLLFLTGLGPLLAWRKSTIENLINQFLWPVGAMVATVAALVALHLTQWASLICFALCAFVSATILQEFWRGAKVRRKNTGTDLATALIGLVARNKRRYGGYIVHVGIVLIFLGFAGNAYKRDVTKVLQPGQQMTVGAYTLRNDQVKVTEDGQKTSVFAYISVFKGGKQIDTMYPSKAEFRKHQDEPPRTDAAIRRGVAEDLYLVLASYELGSQTITLNVVINPLVNWVWLGFGMLAFGTGIALMPESTFSFATAKALSSEAAATTTIALLIAAMLLGAPRTASAQHMEQPGSLDPPKSELEKKMRDEIGCTCGGCAHEPLSKCICGQAAQMRADLRADIEAGKSHDQIIGEWISKYGGEQFLSMPLDRGFNRVAWIFPYLLGGLGVVGVGFVATRWSKHSHETPSTEKSPEDAAMTERLDDELRNLD
ncbi:MAG TPA: cytochrome c-type biogenesis CcmF C-terminal domain-containing protein, partial [Vicinamibacterales bacterium]|nr:cytochrome c-type biogenesis CcmF C-terminal domain-containing protein [Vicinamibacterales bacterium]